MHFITPEEFMESTTQCTSYGIKHTALKIFHETMSRDNFLKTNKFIRFDNKDRRLDRRLSTFVKSLKHFWPTAHSTISQIGV